MNYVFPTKHPSSPDFCWTGGSQFSSNEVFYFLCREGRKPLGDQVPMLSLASRPQQGQGHSHLPPPPLPHFGSPWRLKDDWWHWWWGCDLPTSWTEAALSTTAFDQRRSYLAAGLVGRNRSAWNWDSRWVQDISGKCRKGVQTSYYSIWLCCFCSSSVGMVNEKVVKGSEFPEYLTVSAFLDPCRSGYRRSTAQRLHCTGSPGYRWISGLRDVIVRSISCLWCPEVLLSCFWSSARIDGTVLCSLFP